MKKFFIALFLIIPICAHAQEWTPEQQEVLDHIQVCRGAWDVAHSNANFDHWIKECGAENFSMWYPNLRAPLKINQVKARAEANWKHSGQEPAWSDWTPIAVNVNANVAMVYFYSYSVTRDESGAESLNTLNGLEVFVKEDGRWHARGGMRNVDSNK